MRLTTVSTALGLAGIIATLSSAQSLSDAHAPANSSSKPLRVERFYVFSWPNGYSAVAHQTSMSSSIVSNIDFNIVGPELWIERPEATYCFIVSRIQITRDVLSALRSYGLVDAAGFDLAWPDQLPPRSGSAAYVTVSDQRLPQPDDSIRGALNVLHEYYQSHRLQLTAEANARAIAEAAQLAAPTPTPNPPVSFKRIEYSTPSPGRP